MTRNVLKYPKHVLLEDQETGLIIYGKETDKPVNISATGFGPRFFKVFTFCIFAVGFLMGISPVALSILGVDSLTIGPTNSLYTIFEFHRSENGFSINFFPMSLLAISVIAGLVYSIFKSANNQKSSGDC